MLKNTGKTLLKWIKNLNKTQKWEFSIENVLATDYEKTQHERANERLSSRFDDGWELAGQATPNYSEHSNEWYIAIPFKRKIK